MALAKSDAALQRRVALAFRQCGSGGSRRSSPGVAVAGAGGVVRHGDANRGPNLTPAIALAGGWLGHPFRLNFLQLGWLGQ